MKKSLEFAISKYEKAVKITYKGKELINWLNDNNLDSGVCWLLNQNNLPKEDLMSIGDRVIKRRFARIYRLEPLVDGFWFKTPSICGNNTKKIKETLQARLDVLNEILKTLE